MIPGIRNKPTYTLNIPELSGGMNLRDGISLINDNQLTDCKNMWYKDGMLRTRPRVSISASGDYTSFNVLPEQNLVKDIKVFEDISFAFNGRLEEDAIYYLTVIKRSEGSNKTHIDLSFRSPEDDRVIDIYGKYEHSDGNIYSWIFYDYPVESISYFAFKQGRKAYLFLSCPENSIYDIYEIDADNAKSKLLTENDMHFPLVATDCLPAQATDFEGAVGNMIDGFNLLTGYYKAKYSTVDKNSENTEMCYMLLHPTRKAHDVGQSYAIGKKVKAEYTDINGNVYSHEVTIGEDGEGNESKPGEDGLTMWVIYDSVVFFSDKTEGEHGYAILPKSDYVKNNLIITAPGPHKETDKLKVFNMTKSKWFGGSAYGIYGGTRLFLGGNTSDGEQALVLWSGLNNPLYFSENNYAYVGDKSQAVTAFGLQADNLVIFKEREIYQTQYVSGGDVTAEELINQSSVDLSTLSAYFPLAMVHGYIGCDCPDTVQLCRNRLVWANSDGKVYSLVTQSQYNERSIFEVSEMLKSKLEKDGWKLKQAFSADWNGHYLLFVENKVYVMDYNSYGYSHIYSYLKNEDANLNIPWYYWELPITPKTMLSADTNGIKLATIHNFKAEGIENDYRDIAGWYTLSETGIDIILSSLIYLGSDPLWMCKTETVPIESVIQTKLFDFNQPAVLKSVPTVNFSFGYNGCTPINIEFLSERQIPDRHTVTMDGAEAQKYSPEFMHSVRLFPYTKGTVRFGARITCDGELMIDSMSLQYKALGGAK